MADFVFNVAKGRAAQLAANAIAGTGGAKVRMLVLEASVADGTAQDYETVATMLGDATTAEWTATNYARKDVTATLARDVDHVNNRQDLDCDDQAWTSVTGNASTDVVFYYDPDGTDTDANSIPLTQHDWVVTPNGGNITVQVADFYRAS